MLKELIANVESGREMVLAPYASVQSAVNSQGWTTLAMVPRERVGEIAGWLVLTGKLHPDSLESWTREQMNVSRGALRVMQNQLAELERETGGGTPAPAPPSEPAGWGPTWVITDLNTFRGGLRGSWEITCYRGERGLEFKNWGTWYLDFKGDGTVVGWFEDYQGTRRPTNNGAIRVTGEASGEAGTILWSGTFQRDGNSLAFTGGKGSLRYTDVVMAEPNLTCSPGSWQKN